MPAQPKEPMPPSTRRGVRTNATNEEASEGQEVQSAASPQDVVTPADIDESGSSAGGDNGGGHSGVAQEQADDGDDPRRVAHELLGQAHAVLVIATRDDVLQHWCPEDLRGSFQDARGPLWIVVGDLQVHIGSGRARPRIATVRYRRTGLATQAQRAGKALEQLVEALTTRNAKLIQAWLKSAAGRLGLRSAVWFARFPAARSSPKRWMGCYPV